MANTRDNFNTCFAPKYKARRIAYREGGWAHSMTEAALTPFLRKNTTAEWARDKYIFCIDDKYQANINRYTPDYILFYGSTDDGAEVCDLIDIKAKSYSKDKEQQVLISQAPGFIDTIQEFEDDSPKHKLYIRSLIILTASECRYYDSEHLDDLGTPAEIYKCPECGAIEFLPAHRQTCTKCGHDFSNDKPFATPGEALLMYKRTMPTRTGATQKYKDTFLKRCEEYNIALSPDDDKFRIEDSNNDHRYYEADFSFVSQDYHFTTYPNVPKLETQVGVFADPEADKDLIEMITRAAANHEMPFDAFVFLTPQGMFITERDHGAVRRPAKFHTCDACGKGYIASDEFPECPHCCGDGIEE